jgi:uncharacterized protein involved in exopolysaccharide biosynthesis
MTYIRNGKRAHLDALRIQQQIAAAEVAKAEAELAAIQEAEIELARLQRRKERAAEGLKAARERTMTARVQLALPPVIHGGREGLEAAAREAAGWWTRKKTA